MAELTSNFDARQKRELPVLANFLITSAMMACLATGITSMLETFIPTWRAGYLPWISFLMALQALYVVRFTRQADVMSRNWLLYRGAELVSILVLLKLISYAISGFDHLLDDLRLWQQDFVVNFFESKYLLACLVVVSVWIVSHLFAKDLVELEADDAMLARERANDFRINRDAIRRSLMLKVVITGTVLVAFTVSTRAAMRFTGGDIEAVQVNVFNMLLYMALGMLLLSLARYTSLRAAWFRERADISPEVVRRWVGYVVVLLVVLAVVALMLPTRYSVGLLSTLNYLLSLAVVLLQFLFYFILLVITFPLNLLLRLFGQKEIPATAAPKPPEAPAQFTDTVTSPDMTLEMIKSILFWVVFVAVIVLAVIYFLRQNRALLASLRGIPVLGWVIRGLTWVWNALRLGGQRLSAVVDAGLRRLRPQVPLSALLGERRERFNLRRASTREQVLYFYLAMVRRGGQRGLPRKGSQTPREYAARLDDAAPEVVTEINALTESFEEARYSRHDVEPERVMSVRTYWERIRAALRRRNK